MNFQGCRKAGCGNDGAVKDQRKVRDVVFSGIDFEGAGAQRGKEDWPVSLIDFMFYWMLICSVRYRFIGTNN